MRETSRHYQGAPCKGGKKPPRCRGGAVLDSGWNLVCLKEFKANDLIIAGWL